MMSDILYWSDYLPEYEKGICKACNKDLFDLTIIGMTGWDSKRKSVYRYKCLNCSLYFNSDFKGMKFNHDKGEWIMDKAYKKLGKEAKKIEKDTKAVLKKDKARDKIIDKAKEMKKKGC
jgi:hypothetical protein